MNNDRNEFIDYGKGFSILTIIVYHYLSVLPLPSIMQKAIMLGGTGAHFFIILSAFGLMLTSYSSALNFYSRRFTKILIPYYVFISLIFAINIFVPLSSERSLYAYFGHIFLYKMFDDSIVTSFGAQFWYISTIVQFYLMFPLLKKMLLRFGSVRFFLVCLSISVVYWFFISLTGKGEMRVWNSSSFQYLWEFSLGMIVSLKLSQGSKPIYAYNWYYYFALAFIGLGTMGILTLEYGSIGRIVNDIPAVFGYVSISILIYQFLTRYSRRLLGYIKEVGKYSYSLFLSHILILQIAMHISKLAGVVDSYLAFVVIACVPICFVFSKWYEILIQKMFHRPNHSTPR